MERLMQHQFQVLARYNRWANARLFTALKEVDASVLRRDGGAPFGSIIGTLNHLLVADRIWHARIHQAPLPALVLDSILTEDIGELEELRRQEDARLLALTDALSPKALTNPVRYQTSRGELFATPLIDILSHVFHHQTHHRGQVHALLNRFVGAAPALDLIYYGRETGDLIATAPAGG